MHSLKSAASILAILSLLSTTSQAGDATLDAQDAAEAVKRYLKVAEQGNATAQNILGTIYANGQGVTQDYVQAYMWFNLAAAQGLALARRNQFKSAQRMTPVQVAEAQRMALAICPVSGQYSDVSAPFTPMVKASRRTTFKPACYHK